MHVYIYNDCRVAARASSPRRMNNIIMIGGGAECVYYYYYYIRGELQPRSFAEKKKFVPSEYNSHRIYRYNQPIMQIVAVLMIFSYIDRYTHIKCRYKSTRVDMRFFYTFKFTFPSFTLSICLHLLLLCSFLN